MSAAEAVYPGADPRAGGFSSAAMVWTADVQTKKQKQKPKDALNPGKHKTCECWVRAPSLSQACHFTAAVERLHLPRGKTSASPEARAANPSHVHNAPWPHRVWVVSVRATGRPRFKQTLRLWHDCLWLDQQIRSNDDQAQELGRCHACPAARYKPNLTLGT